MRNLQPYMVPKLHFASMFLLLFTANGIFEPLEVALNRAWGVTRTFLRRNQIVSLGLIFLCGGLALLSLMLTALNSRWISDAVGTHAKAAVWINLLFFKLAALPVSILALFLIYWLLPNRKVEPRRVVPVAIVVGLALEVLKYVNLAGLALPANEAGPRIFGLSALRHDSAVGLRRRDDRARRAPIGPRARTGPIRYRRSL